MNINHNRKDPLRSLSYVLPAVTVSLSGCAAQSKGSDIVILLNDDAAKAISRYRDAVSKKRVPVEFDPGEKTDTRESYMRLAAKSALKEDVANQLGKSEYLMCDLLAIVDRKTMAGDIQKTTAYGMALASRLDLRTFPSSLFQMLDENKYTLTQLDAKAVKTTTTSASSETDEWRYRLELVAVLDADKNGKPDWVLWLSDESKPGNYHSCQTLIAYDVTGSGVIGAKPYRQK